MAAAGPQEVVVCGGGIVGCATAYFLSLKGIHVTLIERCGVACAASGKAGGFLARGWGDRHTEALHQQGFDLHAKLAMDLNLESYRQLPTLKVSGGRRGRASQKGSTSDFQWVDLAGSSLMDSATAQVNPAEVTHKLFEGAASRGATLLNGAVEGVKRDGDQVTAVVVDGKEVPCDAAVFTLGPWSVLVERWLPEARVPMEGILSTSLVFRLPAPVEPPCALFCDEDEFGCHLEVNPRVDSSVYVCGCGGSKYLASEQLAVIKPEEVLPDPKRVQAASQSLRSKTSVTGEVDPEAGACIRPCPPDAKPLLGQIVGNAFIACGHNCWGILWGPLTGLIMAELVTGGESPVSLAPFNPGRFAPRQSKRGRHQKDRPVGEQW